MKRTGPTLIIPTISPIARRRDRARTTSGSSRARQILFLRELLNVSTIGEEENFG
jgi:hypothetical protein